MTSVTIDIVNNGGADVLITDLGAAASLASWELDTRGSDLFQSGDFFWDVSGMEALHERPA